MKYPPLRDLLKIRFKVLFVSLPPDRYADVNSVEDCENQLISVIRINLLRRTDPARCLLHELLHLHYPEMPETKVGQVERRMWRKMGQYERWMVYRRLFRYGWHGAPVRPLENG